MSDAVHCGRCGDFECRLGADCGGADCDVCGGYRCEACGAGFSPPENGPPGTARIPQPIQSQPVSTGRAILTVAVLFTAIVAVLPPVTGIAAKIVWRLFLWGWELIP